MLDSLLYLLPRKFVLNKSFWGKQRVILKVPWVVVTLKYLLKFFLINSSRLRRQSDIYPPTMDNHRRVIVRLRFHGSITEAKEVGSRYRHTVIRPHEELKLANFTRLLYKKEGLDLKNIEVKTDKTCKISLGYVMYVSTYFYQNILFVSTLVMISKTFK